MRSAASKPPAAVPILGAISLLFAMLTLCAGGLRFVRPEDAIGADAISPVFDVAAARLSFYVAVVLWMLLGVFLAIAGGALLVGRRWARRVALIWVWSDIASVVLLAIWNVAFVAPALDHSHLDFAGIFWTAASGPLTGCCPTVWALALLAALHHESITSWATSRSRE